MSINSFPQPIKKRFYKRVWFWILLIIFLLLGIGIAASQKIYKKSQRESYNYLQEGVTVKKRDIRKTISTSGILVSDAATHLRAQVPGTVGDVLVSVGDDVEQDEVLLKVGGIEMRSPFDGRILVLNTFKGDVVSPEIPLVEVGYRTSHIEFLASDSERINLKVGQKSFLVPPSSSNKTSTYMGAIEFVDTKKIVSSSGSQVGESGYLVKISTGDMPSEYTKTIGLSVDVEIVIEERDSVLSVITGAVQYDDTGNTFVYTFPTIDEVFLQQAKEAEDITSLLSIRSVKVGLEGDDYAEITEGLENETTVLFYVPKQKSSLPF